MTNKYVKYDFEYYNLKYQVGVLYENVCMSFQNAYKQALILTVINSHTTNAFNTEIKFFDELKNKKIWQFGMLYVIFRCNIKFVLSSIVIIFILKIILFKHAIFKWFKNEIKSSMHILSILYRV